MPTGHNRLERPTGLRTPGFRRSGAQVAASTLPAVGATLVVARLAGEVPTTGINGGAIKPTTRRPNAPLDGVTGLAPMVRCRKGVVPQTDGVETNGVG